MKKILLESFNNSVSTSVHKHEDSRTVITPSELSSGPESVLPEPEYKLEESSVTIETAESGKLY